MQDLTYNDVKNYVEDKLGQDPLMQKLEMAESGATLQLINGITSKASGVLLWVVLVVKRLRNGLQDYDTISDLLQKLDELPPSLEKLYVHILGSMSPRNRRQGSKLLKAKSRSFLRRKRVGVAKPRKGECGVDALVLLKFKIHRRYWK